MLIVVIRQSLSVTQRKNYGCYYRRITYFYLQEVKKDTTLLSFSMNFSHKRRKRQDIALLCLAG
jgi:hypothetical protein